MTKHEIRAQKLEVTCDVQVDQVAPIVADCAFMLREIAAQLAELNEQVASVIGRPSVTADRRLEVRS
jgi:hypothetical protein